MEISGWKVLRLVFSLASAVLLITLMWVAGYICELRRILNKKDLQKDLQIQATFLSYRKAV